MVTFTGRDRFVTIPCRMCKVEHSLVVDAQDMFDWNSGKLIQEAMPYLSREQRELLISGTCGDCFDEMCGDFDDWDDETS
mgnify:CR=1 FL=1